MEDVKTKSGQNLGVAALITGIITFVLAVIPCVGIIAIIPGIIAIVLASVGLSQANRNDGPRGVLIAGLVIGVIAIMIAFSQIFVVGRIANHADRWPRDIQSVFDDVKKDVTKSLEKGSVSIKIESNGDKVEINASSNNDDRVKQLENLESGKKEKNDTLKKENDTLRKGK
jgi:phosphate/sulfate permease